MNQAHSTQEGLSVGLSIGPSVCSPSIAHFFLIAEIDKSDKSDKSYLLTNLTNLKKSDKYLSAILS